MCGNFGRRLRTAPLILLALLLLSPFSCWADVVLTDQEATALKQSLMTAKSELKEQRQQIEKLQQQLNGAKAELTTASEALERSRTETEALKDQLTKLSGSLKERKREERKVRTKALFIGLGIGIVGGAAGGFYLGAK